MAVLNMAQVLLAREAAGPDNTINQQNRGHVLLGSCISLMTIMVIVMITRIYCRAVLLKKMGYDDWFMIVAAVCAVGLVICSCLGVAFGNGKHIWVVPWQDLIVTRKTGYFGQIFYFLALACCKVSLLLFIIRLRPSTRVITIAWSVLGFCTTFAVAAFISSCLQCIPVSFFWNVANPNLPEIKHYCVNQVALQFTLPSINILTDFVVWLLPIKMIWNIHLPKRQKWSLFVIFSLGGLGVLAGILRLWSVAKAMGSTDVSYDWLDLTIWSNIEVLISITLGSAPAVKPFFTRHLPGLLGVSSFNSHSGNHPFPSGSNNPFPSGSNHSKSRTGRSRGKNNDSYALESISGGDGMSRTEHSSTEEFRVTGGNTTTKIEASSSGDGESEYSRRDLVLDGIVKSTDVQVLVEERV